MSESESESPCQVHRERAVSPTRFGNVPRACAHVTPRFEPSSTALPIAFSFLSLSTARSMSDLNCFICQERLMDPVTLPCGHSFCKATCLSALYTLTAPMCATCCTPVTQHYNEFSSSVSRASTRGRVSGSRVSAFDCEASLRRTATSGLARSPLSSHPSTRAFHVSDSKFGA